MAANGASKKVATDFEKIIHDARDRKKNEALAARIFSKDRRSSLPPKGPASNTGGSLASRSGVKKNTQRVASNNKPRHSTGNIDGDWVHDLHKDNRPNSLASRVSHPNAGPPANPRKMRRAAQVEKAIKIEQGDKNRRPSPNAHATAQQQPITTIKGAANNRGLTIRGLAGPSILLAQNFAPGTTAADIESAMTPIGGIINRCRIIKISPVVIAEIELQTKEGADAVIAHFNGQTADGRVLAVFHKPGNNPTPDSHIPSSGPRGMHDSVVDGTMGFAEPMTMDTDDGYYSGGNGRQAPRGAAAANNSGLYSDDLMRKGRGFSSRGRGF
ncbi:hypothetical protein OQA88_9224 [Cercophora sp. LCS_1]